MARMDASKPLFFRLTQTENVELKKKCTTLEKQNSQMRLHGSSSEADVELRTEVSALRMDKECLEKKVRKFAMHCQRLEDDKAGMRDALRSCNIESNDHDGDLSETVIQLCDRLASAQKNQAQQAAFLKQSDISREKEKQQLLSEVQSLKEKLESARLKIKELENSTQRQRGDNREIADLQKRIVDLEQENLQLMQDLKSTKKDLKRTKIELGNAQANSSGEPTIDFSAVAERLPLSTKSTRSTRRTRSAAAKEQSQPFESSSDTMELTQLALSAAGNQAPAVLNRKIASSKQQSTKKRRKALTESTNREEAPEGTRNDSTATKRQRRQVVHRSAGEDEQAKRRTPGLGESSSTGGSASSENPSECNQQ